MSEWFPDGSRRPRERLTEELCTAHRESAVQPQTIHCGGLCPSLTDVIKILVFPEARQGTRLDDSKELKSLSLGKTEGFTYQLNKDNCEPTMCQAPS